MTINSLVVAFGGVSPEHEVSVITAHQAIAALKDTGITVYPLYVTKTGKWLTGEVLLELQQFSSLSEVESKAIPCTISRNADGFPILLDTRAQFLKKPTSWPISFMLLAFHGSDGENGSFQGLCNIFNVPYSGSGVMGSAISMDKVVAKKLAKLAGISVVDWVDFTEQAWISTKAQLLAQIKQLKYPLVVKPTHLGSSIGISKVSSDKELEWAIESVFRFDDRVLIEKAIDPLIEINCSVIGDGEDNQTSVCEQPVAKGQTLSYEDKYLSESQGSKGMASADRLIPAPISESMSSEVRDTASKLFTVLQAKGLVRIDFLIDAATQQLYFNEINAIPGSFSFYLWQHSKLQFPELLQKLIQLGLKEYRIKNGRVRSYETNLLSKKAITGLKGLKTS
jgi:D-alanine-D-alanine ligase